MLKPPSAFQLRPSPSNDTAALHQDKGAQTFINAFSVESQTECSTQRFLCNFTSFIDNLLSGSTSTNANLDVSEAPPDLQQLCENIAKLGSSYIDKCTAVTKLTAAVQRTVPETVEHQRTVQSLQQENYRLEQELEGVRETVSLLEKRMECQSRVLSIQEKGLSGDGSVQGMLKAWRTKVLQMLIEKEMDSAVDNREQMSLNSKIQKLEKSCDSLKSEVELMKNKNCDLQANIRLKDKHIQSLTNELSSAKLSQQKHDQMALFIERTCCTVADKVTDFSTNIDRYLPNRDTLLDKLAMYEEQICRISENVLLLQSISSEKEEFYNNKLESLLVEHTRPVRVQCASAHVQTELDWGEIAVQEEHLRARISEQQGELSAVLLEKGVNSSRLAEAETAVADFKSTISLLREQLSCAETRHIEEVSGVQKRETKAAMRAKQLERLLVRKEGELGELEVEVHEKWKEEVEGWEEKVGRLRRDNENLKQAIRKGM